MPARTGRPKLGRKTPVVRKAPPKRPSDRLAVEARAGRRGSAPNGSQKALPPPPPKRGARAQTVLPSDGPPPQPPPSRNLQQKLTRPRALSHRYRALSLLG